MERGKLTALKTVLLITSFYLGFWALFELLRGVPVGSVVSPSRVVLEEILNGFVVLFLLRRVRQCSAITLSEIGLTYHTLPRDVFFGAFMGAILWLVTGFVSTTIEPIIPDWGVVPQGVDSVALYNSMRGIWKAILFSIFVFTTPLIEEIFYRGIIHSVLRRAFSISATLLLSSGIFGLFHVYLALVIHMFLIGCGLTLLREWRKSLVAPMIAHATVNCLSLVPL